jgi:hypothetical protein
MLRSYFGIYFDFGVALHGSDLWVLADICGGMGFCIWQAVPARRICEISVLLLRSPPCFGSSRPHRLFDPVPGLGAVRRYLGCVSGTAAAM